jgi:colanic acid/amylovoran biosynthesis glycosyltransferase
MIGKLAIFCPNIGGLSESFIRRHIEFLCPGKTVIITNNIFSPDERTWEVNCPVYLTKKAESTISKGISFIRRKMGVGEATYVDVEGVKKFLYEQEVDLLWGHYLNRSWPLIRIANELGIRFFVHALGYDLSRMFRKAKWRRRYADYKHASGVIVLNKIMQDRLISVGISEEKVHIIPCGVDVPENRIVRTATDMVHCLAVGRMVGKKAPLKLLESFRLALQQNLNMHLDYVGTGPLFKKAQGFVHAHGLQNHVTLHGGQPHQVVIDLMHRADLFLQHSIVDPKTGDEEGMPVVILEAMAQGLPVVSTKHAGIPEAVLDGLTGYIVEEGNVNGMAKHILELAEDAQKRLRMGERGWRTARDNYTWQIERAKLLDLMDICD